MKSFLVSSSITPYFLGFNIYIARFLVCMSQLRMDKVFYFFTFLNTNLERMARDTISLFGAPPSIRFLFLSKVFLSHDSVPITLDVVPCVSTPNIFLLTRVNSFEVEEKTLFGAREMSFGASDTFFSFLLHLTP